MIDMEDTCSNSRRSQCKGYRRRPQLGLWMWFIIMKCLFSSPCISSMCQGVNISVSLYPEGMINVRYGDPLELFCIADVDTKDNTTTVDIADNLEFCLGGTHLESEKVNSTTRRLFIKNISRRSETYYCRNNATKKKCTTRVLVDLPPTNVTDFSCISKNLEELNCSWTGTEEFSKTNYSVTPIANNVGTKPCLAVKAGHTRYCSWNTTSAPRYKQQEDQFHFHLKSCNFFGCTEQEFTINHFAIVKPDKPEKLQVIQNNTHSVLLQWDIPSNIVDFLCCTQCPSGIVHRIEYQIAKIDNTAHFHSVETTLLPQKRNKTYRFLLSDLPYANMLYEVRIYIKTIEATDEKFWSDFSFLMFTTASEIPQRPPDTTIGAFDQSVYEEKRVINVYWKQLEEYEEAGGNFTYKVITYQRSRSSQTKHPDKNKSLSYVQLIDDSFEAIDVYIWSENAIGSSVNRSHLHIPAKRDTEGLSISSFTKLAYENGTNKLSWVGIEHIDNYTLFWCQHNTTKICAGQMNFTVINPKKTTHAIDLPTDHRYQFAISANRGFKTSGMSWASCDISKDAIPMYGFPVKLDHDAPGKTFVRITWTMFCTLQEGIITGYEIHYCPALGTSSDCDSSLQKDMSVIVNDPAQKEINITNLKPYTTYVFRLSMNTIYGSKNIQNASTGVTTTEDTPTNPNNVKISNVLGDSLTISWDPPTHKNGVIGKYIIQNNGTNYHIVTIPDKDKDVNEIKLVDLKPFTNYSFSVRACNIAIGKCSEPSPPHGIFVRTRIASPSILESPHVSTNPGLLEWKPPKIPGGTLDYYEIRRIKDDDDKTAEIINSTGLRHEVILCEGVDESESYQIRAVNLDEDPLHGILADQEVDLPKKHESGVLVFRGEWSTPSIVACGSRKSITMIVILVVVFGSIGAAYGAIKLYKHRKKALDLDVVLPEGLGIPEKEISKYAYGGLYPTNKDDKPPSDEVLLLPNSVSTPENKQNTENNCGSSDHTDSTALSISGGPTERHPSCSDDGSDSSLQLRAESERVDDNDATHDEEESSSSGTDNSRESSPQAFKKNPRGYVLPVVNPSTGYVQSAPVPLTSLPMKPATQPSSSSYVMAALSPPIFTTGVAPPTIPSQPVASSGYVRPEDAQARSMMNFPKLGPSPTKVFGPESLPTMPILPQQVKHGADSSYIQLQSLDSLTSHKQPLRSSVPLKPPASSGYVSPGDAVINKHLNNMLSGGQLAEESAILDPAMSPDAYCRFSWSTDPANDNLHSFLADSQTLKSSKN